MPEEVTLIRIFYGKSLVGKLALGPDRRCVFEYDGRWLQSGFSISPFYLPSLDYAGLLKATLALTRHMDEVEKLFRLMVFNVLSGNRDDHARNFSFIWSDDAWRLSPAYDLLPSDGFAGQHTTTVNGQGNPTMNDCMTVAKEVGFPEKRAREIVEQVKTGLMG